MLGGCGTEMGDRAQKGLSDIGKASISRLTQEEDRGAPGKLGEWAFGPSHKDRNATDWCLSPADLDPLPRGLLTP
ncbi:T-Complex Protein 1 Subunit Theta-Like 1-Like [Manis pentadactyla]|nr:T-Complex Protein 1 Subunit Theta-Like 1-Like [Manis pentadactyla]